MKPKLMQCVTKLRASVPLIVTVALFAGVVSLAPVSPASASVASTTQTVVASTTQTVVASVSAQSTVATTASKAKPKVTVVRGKCKVVFGSKTNHKVVNFDIKPVNKATLPATKYDRRVILRYEDDFRKKSLKFKGNASLAYTWESLFYDQSTKVEAWILVSDTVKWRCNDLDRGSIGGVG